MNLCCGLLIVLSIVGSSTAASIGKNEDDVTKTFTSELDDSFLVTLPRAAVPVDDESSNEEKQIVKTVSASDEERHIPVRVVHEENKGIDAKTVKEEAVPAAVSDPKIVINEESKSTVVAEEVSVVKNDKTSEEDVVPASSQEIPSVVKVVESVEKNDQYEECDESEKSASKISGKAEQEEEVSQEEAAPAPQTPVNIIQQGISNIGQGIRNVTTSISNSINSVLRPNPSSPTLVQNIQNFFNPSTVSDTETSTVRADSNSTTPRPTFASILMNYYNIIQYGLGNFTQNVQNLIRNPVQTANTTLINMQQSMVQLQNTIGGAVQNLTELLPFRPQSSNSSRPSIQSIISGLTNAINNNIQTLNSTVLGLVNRPQSDDESKPSSSRNESISDEDNSSSQDDLAQLHKELEALNKTLLEGVKDLNSEDKEDSVAEKSEKVEVKAEDDGPVVVSSAEKSDKEAVQENDLAPKKEVSIVDEKKVDASVVEEKHE